MEAAVSTSKAMTFAHNNSPFSIGCFFVSFVNWNKDTQHNTTQHTPLLSLISLLFSCLHNSHFPISFLFLISSFLHHPTNTNTLYSLSPFSIPLPKVWKRVYKAKKFIWGVVFFSFACSSLSESSVWFSDRLALFHPHTVSFLHFFFWVFFIFACCFLVWSVFGLLGFRDHKVWIFFWVFFFHFVRVCVLCLVGTFNLVFVGFWIV